MEPEGHKAVPDQTTPPKPSKTSSGTKSSICGGLPVSTGALGVLNGQAEPGRVPPNSAVDLAPIREQQRSLSDLYRIAKCIVVDQHFRSAI